MTLRIGIIGCGGIARAHVEGYRRNDAKITALMDIDRSALAHSVESAKQIVAAAGKSNALLMTAFRHRFLPAIQAIRKAIDKGQIGPVVFFQNTFCGPAFQMQDKWFSKRAIAGGGTLMDTSIHSVDIFRYLIGEVVEQKAVMHRHLAGTDVEDASILILKAANGAIGSLTASWVAGDGMASIDVMGQDGRIVYDYYKADQIRLKQRGEAEWKTIPVKASDGFAEEISHFLRAIRGEETLSCTGQDGLRAVEIIQANY
jgi:predicted dehydrogenase